MNEITDINDERIKEFSNLKNRTLENNNQIIVESNKVVTKLLKSSSNILKIFTTKKFLEENKSLLSNVNEIYYANPDVLKQIAGSEKHHGVFALANKPKLVSLENLSDKIIILNGLTSPENVGAIMRTAAAFRVDSLIYDSKTVSPFTRRCIRVSMGNIFSLKIHKTNNLLTTLSELKDLGFINYSTANINNAKFLNETSFYKKSSIIIGSEGHGIDKEVLELSDKILKINIDDHVAHLNAGHASAIFLYELTK